MPGAQPAGPRGRSWGKGGDGLPCKFAPFTFIITACQPGVNEVWQGVIGTREDWLRRWVQGAQPFEDLGIASANPSERRCFAAFDRAPSSTRLRMVRMVDAPREEVSCSLVWDLVRMTVGGCSVVRASIHNVDRSPASKIRRRHAMSEANCFECPLPALFGARRTSLAKHCSLCKASHDLWMTKELTSVVRDAATSERHMFGMCRVVGMLDARRSSKLGTRVGHGASKDVRGASGSCWSVGGATLLPCRPASSSSSRRGPLH